MSGKNQQFKTSLSSNTFYFTFTEFMDAKTTADSFKVVIS